MSAEAIPRMPDLTSALPGFHHTVDSALEILCDLGVSPNRITLRMAGRGWPSRWVVEQSPPGGSLLGPDVSVSLSVAGLGFFHALPVGMWDKGGDTEPGTQEILELLDDPIQKSSHWVRAGARLFDIQPGNYAACSRWISLFGLNPDEWPTERWYNLALLLPSLHRLGGTAPGIRLALWLLLDLPLKEIRGRPARNYLEDEDLTLLARRASRLGMDCIVGDVVEDLSRLVVVVGPVRLETYKEFQEDEGRRRLGAVLDLCMPYQHQYGVSWFVLHPDRTPRLGLEKQNSRLGVNSRLGRVSSEPTGDELTELVGAW